MSKSFVAIGICSILFVSLLAFTCPGETDFERHLERELGIACTETGFTCERNGKKLTIAETSIRNGVFFMIGERTFESGQGGTLTVRSFGMLNTFFRTTIAETSE